MSQKKYLNEYNNYLANINYANEYAKQQMNQEKQFIVAHGHGSTTNKEFILPVGINVIFITDVGKSLLASDNIFRPVINTYLEGHSLFNNYDNSKVISPSGRKIEELLKNLIKKNLSNPYRSYKIKNIIGDGTKKILDHNIFFSGLGCNKHRYSCKMMKGIIGQQQSGIIIDPKETGYGRNSIHINRPENRNYLRNTLNDEYHITLFNLIKKFGEGSYIILGCRNFSTQIPLQILRNIGSKIRSQKLQNIKENISKRRNQLRKKQQRNGISLNGPYRPQITTGGNKKINRKKKYIKIKNYGKRLIRYTKTNKKYIILNGKKKYIK